MSWTRDYESNQTQDSNANEGRMSWTRDYESNQTQDSNANEGRMSWTRDYESNQTQDSNADEGRMSWTRDYESNQTQDSNANEGRTSSRFSAIEHFDEHEISPADNCFIKQLPSNHLLQVWNNPEFFIRIFFSDFIFTNLSFVGLHTFSRIPDCVGTLSSGQISTNASFCTKSFN